MGKVKVVTTEIDTCINCPFVRSHEGSFWKFEYYCSKVRDNRQERLIKDNVSQYDDEFPIPDWCPLEDYKK